jgi:hypothetical protein
MESRSMFATLDGARWFTVPDDLAWGAPDGDGLEVRGLLGQRRRAPEAVLAGFEVDREQGIALARRELFQTIGGAGRALSAVRALAESQGRDTAALARLEQGIASVAQALRPEPNDRASELARVNGTTPPPPPEIPDLRAVFEGWVRAAAEDPQAAEKIRRAAEGIAAAGERLRQVAAASGAPDPARGER